MSYKILNASQPSPQPIRGIGDLQTDSAAAIAWLWNETRAFVAKFPFQDRIDVNDVNQAITDIANYIAAQSGSNNATIPSSAQAIFWNDLVPSTQSEWKKAAPWTGHPTYTGYRLSPETIQKAGASIGYYVSAFRTGSGTAGGGGTGGGGAAGGGSQWSWVTDLLKSPWALLGIGAAMFGVLYVIKKQQIKGKGGVRWGTLS